MSPLRGHFIAGLKKRPYKKEGWVMGKQARAIVDLSLKDLIKDLNKAYCDEWLAFYLYWYMAQAVEGKGYEVADGDILVVRHG